MLLSPPSSFYQRQREYVGSVIVGATSLVQLKENLEAFNDPQLDGLLDDQVLAEVITDHHHSRHSHLHLLPQSPPLLHHLCTNRFFFFFFTRLTRSRRSMRQLLSSGA
jgi:hypothetical protein